MLQTAEEEARLSPGMPYAFVPFETKSRKKVYTLFRGWKDSSTYASSPFVTKVEFRMRLAGIEYRNDCGAPWMGPKGKIPYLKISDSSTEQEEQAQNAQILGDSALIIKYLVEEQGLEDLNKGLSGEDKSKDLAIRALLEDKLYFYHMRECWIDNYYAQ
ncbi:hypothetical protein AAFC00_001534 [Neodothiora populina]|uniref:Thioredoxin-like fold domain-containing protein n=2 Tax=Neodothiora populina TaxID=2781224 RepID=A0ABR3PPM3_9PEZI